MSDLKYAMRPTKLLVTCNEFPCSRCAAIDYLTADAMLCAACNSGGVVVNRMPKRAKNVKRMYRRRPQTMKKVA